MENSKAKIEFDYEGEHYVLEYTASSLKKMERQGFEFANLDKIILTVTEKLFCGAFIANHDNVRMVKREKIYRELTSNSDEAEESLSEVLNEMLSEAIDELNSHEGKVTWRVSR